MSASIPGQFDPRVPTRPLVALTLGDPAGIGPELVARALEAAGLQSELSLCAIGPACLRPARIPLTRAGHVRSTLRESRADAVWVDSWAPERWEMGRAQAACGRAALAALRIGHELALSGEVDALVTAPVNKEAMHMAGERIEGQTELLGRWCGVERIEMLALAGRLRVMLLTRHMSLVEAIRSIRTERVLDRLRLFDQSLRRFGIARPRLALAGLNPHAGESGLFGTEEAELLVPAVASARADGLDVHGPLSPDTVFLQASRGQFDGVLALYHDQAFIPIKLLDPDGGVTVIAGLPYLRVSPIHGTAFDIAGKGIASAANLIAALRQAAEWSVVQREQSLGR